MVIEITIKGEPSLTRVYNYDENVDYNDMIADMVESVKSLKE